MTTGRLNSDKLTAALALVESIRAKIKAQLADCDRLEASLRAQYGGAEEPLTVEEARRRPVWVVEDSVDTITVNLSPVRGTGLTWDAAVAHAERLAARRGFSRWGTNRWAPPL